MGGGGSSGGGSSSSTTTTEPWDGAKPYLTDIMAKAKSAYDQVNPAAYTGPNYAGPNQTQLDANKSLLDLSKSPQFTSAANNENTFLTNLTGGMYADPSKNTALQGAISAADEPIIRNFKESISPGVDSAAIASGAYGGARNGLAQGRAEAGLATSLANTNAAMTYQNYQDNQQNQLKAVAALQPTQTAMAAGGTTQAALGGQQQGWDQDAINAAISKYNSSQLAPFTGLQQYASLISNPGGTTTSTQAQGSNGIGNLLGGALGGGLLGAGASAAFPETLAALGPYGWAAGAGLGLMSALS